ncbi:MAG: hypothetical protein MZU97_18905 [Bacillus subtilis]|nr:hypothetical protein [Bacillus subtilis]
MVQASANERPISGKSFPSFLVRFCVERRRHRGSLRQGDPVPHPHEPPGKGLRHPDGRVRRVLDISYPYQGYKVHVSFPGRAHPQRAGLEAGSVDASDRLVRRDESRIEQAVQAAVQQCVG